MNTFHLPQRRILVVDDEPLVCETVCMLLQFDGHVVGKASSGQEALTLFEPGKFDLVVTDFCMPAMTGGELALAIKKRSPNQPVVLLTAYSERFKAPNPPLVGVDFVIEKPIPAGSLNEALTRFASSRNSDSPSNTRRVSKDETPTTAADKTAQTKDDPRNTLIVVGFDHESGALEMRAAVTRFQSEYFRDLEDSVVVTRDQQGRVKLHQAANLPDHASTLWGFAIGVMFVDPLLDGAIGAGTGVRAQSLACNGITDDFMKGLGDTLTPGTSLIFIMVRKSTPDCVLTALKPFIGQAKVLRTLLTQHIEEALYKYQGGVRLGGKRINPLKLHLEALASALNLEFLVLPEEAPTDKATSISGELFVMHRFGRITVELRNHGLKRVER